MNVASARYPSSDWSLDRLSRHFGGIPAERILLDPEPGTATEDDLLRRDGIGRTCELIDRCLVEKAMGASESLIAGILIHLLHKYLEARPLGIVLSSDGTIKLEQGLVRAPDACFISWDSIGSDDFPEAAFPVLPIDLAIEVVSRSNTVKEIARKIDEYFAHGTKLAWVIHPKKKVVDVYRSPSDKKQLTERNRLTAPKVLPGFSLPVQTLFSGFRRPKS